MGCTGSKGAEGASAPQDKATERDARMSSDTPLLRAEDFKVGAYIQTGAMGKVYRGVLITDNSPVALKFFGYTSKTPDASEIYEEINLMTALRGVEGMVQLLGVFSDPAQGIIDGKRFPVELPVIVMEHLGGGDLMDRILMSKFVSEKQLAAIFRHVVETLKEIHRRGFIHRDLKLENIIFESNKDDALVKIVDFGMMVKLDKKKTTYYTLLIQGTPGYLAPESINEMEYSSKSDFFAAGCCFYAMLSGEMPFDPSDPRAPAKIPYAPMTGKAWENISDDAKSFLDFMLQADKNTRPDAEQILAHPWLSGQANDKNLDTEYFSRLKSLALRQKIRTFFSDNNIFDNNRKRQAKLNHAVSNYRSLHSPPVQKRPSMSGTSLTPILENEDLKMEYERKLHRLRAVVIKTLKPDFSFDDSLSEVGTVPDDPVIERENSLSENSPMRARMSSVASAAEDVSELSATFRKYVMENGEIPLEGFVELLKCVGLDDFANYEVFKIFDTERNGSIDMKDVLLTMIAMKSVDDTAMPLMGGTAPNAEDISMPRRSTALKLVDDAKLYFDMFDVKQTGYIDMEELKLVMDFMVPESDEEAKEAMDKNIEEMFALMDVAKNGRVDFEEFKIFYHAVMVATTKIKIGTGKSMSFAKAIDLVQRRASSSDFNEDRALSRNSSRSPSFT